MRAHGEGTVIRRERRRKDGSKVVRWVAIVTRPDGSRQSQWCATRAEAEEARKQLTRLRSVNRLDDARLDLGPFLERWVSSVELAPGTLKQHRNAIVNHLVPALGHIRLTELRPSDVDEYLSRKDLHPQTLRHHRATLRRALADALRDGIVSRNVAALSRPPRMQQVERTFLDAAQAMRLIQGTRGEWVHAPLTIALTTGLRQAELLALLWSEIDWKAGSLTVRYTLHRVVNAPDDVDPWERRPPKTEKSRRTVTLTPLALETLRAHKAAQDEARGATAIDGLIFTTVTGRPVNGPNLLPPLHEACRRLGLPQVSWHDLRHSTASILLAAGVPLPVISRMLGHSTIRVTADLYAHVVPQLERDAAAAMEQAMRRTVG